MPSQQPQTPELAYDCLRTEMSAASNKIYKSIILICIIIINIITHMILIIITKTMLSKTCRHQRSNLHLKSGQIQCFDHRLAFKDVTHGGVLYLY